jgi:NhaP-type Na+/H+ or K+/H+ antiporter
MLLNFCIIVLLALLISALFEKIKLPGLLGMLLVGVVMGPSVLDLMHPTLMEVSGELRTFALIVILLRAGLGIKKESLNQVGKTALLMSFIPGVFEGVSIMVVAHLVVDMPLIEAGILGFIIAAVSPAVVVPQMLRLKDLKIGEKKQIPTLILAGASLDDIVAITIYSGFLALYFGNQNAIAMEILKVPIGITTGVLLGGTLGLGFTYMFKKLHIRDTKKVMMILMVGVLLNAFETHIITNTLLGIMTIGLILLEKMPEVANRLSVKLNKVWVFAEIILFVLIGARVDISVISGAGVTGLIIIGIGLIFRSIGVLVALSRSHLNGKEKAFTVAAYIPKATVQAAIGAVPLSRGVAHGDYILAVAVLSILVTAPLGAIAIRKLAPICLSKD